MSHGVESVFCCPVCGGALERGAGQYRCSAGHGFDVAREGYVNLLPANRRHSRTPGDDKEMASARSRFLEGGWYGPLRDALCKLVERYAPPKTVLLDAGCGEGWYTGALAEAVAKNGGRTAGLDLSKPSVRRAARRCPAGEFAVGTVYHLPVADASVDVLVDCFSPLAVEEFARVLKPGGTFLYVVPGPRHLWELKEILYDQPYENGEKREEYPGLCCRDVVAVETEFTLPDRQAALDALTVTGQFRIHVLERTSFFH